jgi:hypothetical protein
MPLVSAASGIGALHSAKTELSQAETFKVQTVRELETLRWLHFYWNAVAISTFDVRPTILDLIELGM